MNTYIITSETEKRFEDCQYHIVETAIEGVFTSAETAMMVAKEKVMRLHMSFEGYLMEEEKEGNEILKLSLAWIETKLTYKVTENEVEN